MCCQATAIRTPRSARRTRPWPSSLVNKRTTSAGYIPYYDYNGAGVISTTDVAIDNCDVNNRQNTITSPAAPAAAPVGGSGFTALALGVQESGSTSLTTGGSTSSGSSTAAIANVIPTGSTSPSAGTTSTSSSSTSGEMEAPADNKYR